MIVSDTLSLALRNLGQAKLRTTLTTLGVAIGIASLAGMVSLGVGLEEQTVGRLTSSGMFDQFTVMQGQGARGRGGFGGRMGGRGANAGRSSSEQAPRRALDDAAIAEIAALPDVKEVYPNITIAVEAQFEQEEAFVTLSGVPASQRDQGAFQTFSAGTFFTDDTSRSCILTLDFARRLTDKDAKELVGQVVTIAYAAATPAPADSAAISMPRRVTQTFTVVGIVERPAGGMAAMGSAGLSGIMIPIEQARAINAEVVVGRQSLMPGAGAPTQNKNYNSLTVKATRAAAVPDLQSKVAALGFTTISLTDLLKNARNIFVILDIILGLIGSIALAVSSLGIVNTMVMSILERTREIGIMKAIGGSDADVRGIFLVEASAIGMLGGALGVALAWVVGRVIMFGANLYVRSQQADAPSVDVFSMPLWLIALGIGFSILVSLIAGSFPARRAARLDPIQALRHD